MSKRGIIITGVALFAFAIYLLAFLLPDFIRSSVGPQPMTMADAAATAGASNSYVALTDGAWNCDTITYLRGRSTSNRAVTTTRFTEVFRTDETGAVVMLVSLSGEVGCDELPDGNVAGYLQRMSADREQDLRNEVRLARFIYATDYLQLCAYCGPTNSLIGVGFGLFFALVGVGLVILGWRK
jgi:hypothetical protein